MSNLIPNPSSLNFGNVTQGQSLTLPILLTNDDLDTITIGGLGEGTGNPDFVFVESTPITVPSFSSVTVHVTYTAGTPGVSNGILVIAHDGNNNPLNPTATGTSVVSGSKLVSSSPSSWDFGPIKTMVTSATKTFTLSNPGTIAATISGITASSPFAVTALPSFPFTLNPGSTVTFGATFTPIGTGYVSSATAVDVASDVSGGHTYVPLAGTGFPITPVFSITSGSPRLMAWDGTLYQFSDTDFNTEIGGSLKRNYDFGMPALQKAYRAAMAWIEDLGAATINFVLFKHGKTVTGANIAIGDNNSNDILGYSQEIELSNDIIEFRVTRVGGAGPVSFTQFAHKVEPERLNRAQFPAITPVFIASGTATLMAGTAAAGLLKFDQSNFLPESTMQLVRTHDLGTPGFEENLLRCLIAFEDLGSFSLRVTATNTRGQTTTQTVAFAGIGDNSLQQIVFDLDITGDRIVVTEDQLTGPLSMTQELLRFVERGEVKK
jgi:hypothetical protein